MMDAIPDTPKEALLSFLAEVDRDYVKWYDSTVIWLRRCWRLSSYIQIGSGFGTSLLAAVATEEWFATYGPLRVILILLPTLAAACTVAVTQSRLYERYQLRENGRRATQTLYYSGCQRFAQATSPEEGGVLPAALCAPRVFLRHAGEYRDMPTVNRGAFLRLRAMRHC